MSDPRKFDSEIIIDAHDRWIFRETEITQEDILKYFRANLHQNEKGVYIENVFGELRENGYLTLNGYPCHITKVILDNSELKFYADDGKVFPFSAIEIYQTDNGNLIGINPVQDKIKYRFNWNAATDFAEFFVEEGEKSFLKVGDLHMEIPIYPETIEVPLPKDYI
ncbi:hypothetical protein LPTSP3_g08060 [Leptospira kobayashii]|uniref:DUF1285 domain-containing protein n=1 Tax=Leptospira kobayashii TaxID=1917830 RepID=A0ABM7UH14_9LEPT|nr:hypothetical protein [Leptospira kobayashii]BDA77876.1 hypothetical protein LPTSP3_g08060 [Leptospira kobayashii]